MGIKAFTQQWLSVTYIYIYIYIYIYKIPNKENANSCIRTLSSDVTNC